MNEKNEKDKNNFDEILKWMKDKKHNVRLQNAIRKLKKHEELNNEELRVLNFISSMNYSEESNKLAKRMNCLTKWLIVATIVNAIAAVINVLFNVC